MLGLLAALLLSQTQAVGPPLTQGFQPPPFQTIAVNGYVDAGPKVAYLIPEDGGGILEHVNAIDLNAGTAHVGTPFTLNGSVTYNSGATPRPSVGPFTDSNYFSQTSASPANVAAAPFTVVVICNVSSLSANAGVFETGTYSSTGYGAYLSMQGGGTFAPYVVANQPITSNTVVTSSTSILMMGVDGSGNFLAQLNNGSVASSTGVVSAGLSTVYLGRYTSTGQPLLGTITELMVSSAVPSSAFFTALYNQIVASE